MILSIFSELLCTYITTFIGFVLGYAIYAYFDLPLTGSNMYMFVAVSLAVRATFLSVVLGYCRYKEHHREK